MEKGKLKIFFGYSAGVGKTYSMLKAARSTKKLGVDIIIGYIEPHDRADTMALTEGFECIPLKEVDYKGITLHEFDVDKAIERKPQIILVDELAHTNCHGSKNKKRYLDVEELINNGIDVWTTVNVQHIEGLHDLVDDVTQVDVNERVPDEVFDMADEVVLIDIEPEDLMERMRQGKVYSLSRAKIALQNFFNENNLQSLRELFLRRGADRLERQSFHGDLKTKILVLISPSPSSEKNIHVAARMADAYHCKFSAMYIERNGDLSDDSAHRLKQYMKLVRNLGGDIIVKYGEDIVETVYDYVKLAGVTNIVMGKTWQSIGRKAGLEDKFIERMPFVEILIVPDTQNGGFRPRFFKNLFSKLLTPKILMEKYKTANKTLDIIQLVSNAALEKNKKASILNALSIAFERSVILYNGVKIILQYGNEDISFFDTEKEVAVAKWVQINNKNGGRGTETIRDAKAIYFPVTTKEGINVIGFSCQHSKMTVTDMMIFSQIQNVLKVIL